METKFVLQNVVNKKYWYGYYSNKNWTEDIAEARFFDSKEELNDWLRLSADYMSGLFLTAVEIWNIL